MRETKGIPANGDLSELRDSERMKIACGLAHFEALNVDYRVVGAPEAV